MQKTQVIIDEDSGNVMPYLPPKTESEEEPILLSSENDKFEASLPPMTGILVSPSDISCEKRGFKKPIRGIVCGIRLDEQDCTGFRWTVVFENGSIQEFSSVEKAIELKIIGYCPSLMDYRYEDLSQVKKDFKNGRFKFE